MRASILSIGTELTDGQILNRNAHWISEKLKAATVETQCHLTVPDDFSAILDALDICSKKSELIFVTGGLGPTSDDFTRDVIAKWCKKRLEFSEETWVSIQKRMTDRGYIPNEEQKQQCYFPESSTILKNKAGTAPGFHLVHDGHHLFVLPGPPHEVAAIWEDFIAEYLTKNAKAPDPLITRIWDTIGKGESNVAIAVERVLKNISVVKGYRAHHPYVEVKVSYRESQELELQEVLTELTSELSSILVTRDGEDLVSTISQEVQKKLHGSLSIVDGSHSSKLFHRLTPLLSKTASWSYYSDLNITAKNSEMRFEFKLLEDHLAEVSILINGKVFTRKLESPYKNPLMVSRSLQVLIEYALVEWLKCLKESSPDS